jgi:hypothetical protein
VCGNVFYLVMLLCMIIWMYKLNFSAREVIWKAMSLSLICIILEEKETHNHIGALIKNNSEFYIPLIQTDGSKI